MTALPFGEDKCHHEHTTSGPQLKTYFVEGGGGWDSLPFREDDCGSDCGAEDQRVPDELQPH